MIRILLILALLLPVCHADEMVRGKARGKPDPKPNRWAKYERLPRQLYNLLDQWYELSYSSDTTNVYSLIDGTQGAIIDINDVYYTNYNGGCRVFAGAANTTNSVEISDANWGQTTNYTYALWCRPLDRGDGENRNAILSKNTEFSANNDEGEFLWITSGGSALKLSYQWYDSAQRLHTSASFTPLIGAWQLIGATVNTTNVELWCNGTNVYNAAKGGTPPDTSAAPAMIGSLGLRYYGAYQFAGYMSAIYKFGTPLTHVQQTNLYNATKWKYGY